MKYAESAYIELKEMINSDFKKEIVAFANTDGGEIFVGINKNGEIVGVTEPEKDMERISNMIRDSIKPDLIPFTSISMFNEHNLPVIKVSVSRGERGPYYLSEKGLKPSGVFIRHGVTSAPANEDTIRQMIRESDGLSFDRVRSINQELTFNDASKFFSERHIAFDDPNKRSLGLINSDGVFTNAAFLLSDQCDYSIKCAIYEGYGKTKFRSRKEFNGSLFRQLDEAYAWLDLINHVSSSFVGLRRVDQHDYPPFALREALINTIVHRDYNYSGSTLVSIFDDRIEIVSIGGLVKGITLTDIMHGISQSRNTILAAIFYRLELIESYGTGIQRIIESYANYPIKPTFMPGPSSFLVTLPNTHTIPALQADANLSDEEKVILLLQEKGTISRSDIEQFLQCSSFPASKILQSLLTHGKIIRIGSARATKYRLKPAAEQPVE